MPESNGPKTGVKVRFKGKESVGSVTFENAKSYAEDPQGSLRIYDDPTEIAVFSNGNWISAEILSETE